MKKVFKISVISFLVLFLIVLALPFVFKDKIKARVDEEIARQVDAQVYFGDFGLTLIRNFPNLTIQLDDFGVVGHGVFKGDTLMDVKRLNIVVDIMSVISGDKINVKKFLLKEPRIHAVILPDGKANWDIYKGSSVAEDTASVDTSASAFAMTLNEYSIENASLVYDDRQGKMYASVRNLTHSGTGDFLADEFVFRTVTEAQGFYYKMDGTTYARNLNMNARVDLDMNTATGMYRFRDNKVSLNDLHLGFDGFVQLAGDDIRMDIKYNTLETEFKNILSLVPGVYTESFSDIKTSGTLALSGTATGTYNASRLPAFSLNMNVGNASLKYPDLPEEVRNINLDMNIVNTSGNLEETRIQLRQFHADLGNNPVDAKAIVTGLTNPDIDASLSARINLAEMMNMFPLEGLELKGILDIKGTAKGIYSDKSMPVVQADMALAQAYMKSADFPSAIDKLSFKANMNSDGSLPNTVLNVENLHAEIDQEPVDLKLSVTHFEDPQFVLDMKGKLDLDKLMKIFPLEGTTLAGKINFALSSKGKQSDVEAGRYMNIPTSGSMQIQNLKYQSADLPQGITISQGDFVFTPQEIKINTYEGTAGSSKISVRGGFQNYLAYALLENQPLSGNLSVSSPRFNVNEWMSDEEVSEPANGEEVPMTPVEVPAGISFVMNTNVQEVLYDNLVLKNVTGMITVKDQAVSMDNVKFGLLDGNFVMGGKYSAANIAKPAFDFSMQIAGLNIQEAYKAFNTIQILAPAAKFVEGNFNTQMRISSVLGMDMMPLMETFTGIGSMLVLDGKVSDMPVVKKLGEASKLTGGSRQIQLKNTTITYRVENGRIHFDPFDVDAGNTKMNISGSNGFDKTINYLVRLDAPSGAAGKAANAALSGVSGGQKLVGDRIKAEVRLGGTFDSPRVLGVTGEGGKSPAGEVKDALQDKASEAKDKALEEADRLKKEAEDKARKEADRLKNEAEARARQEADRLKNEAESRARQQADKLKKEAEDKARQQADKLKKEAEERARQEAEKRAKEEAERKAKEEAEKLKNKLRFPR